MRHALAAEAGLAEPRSAHLKLAIEKLRRALYGSRSERQARLVDQIELELEELEDLEATASEDEIAAQAAAARTSHTSPLRKRPRAVRSKTICRANAS